MKSIAVYCSSSNKVDDIYKEEAKKVGNLLAKKGIRLVYGGGNMGLMGVISNSAINSGGDVYGVITNHLIEIEKRNNSLNNITWKQLRLHKKPIFIYNFNDFWRDLFTLLENIIKKDFAGENMKEAYKVINNYSDLTKELEINVEN